VVGEFFIFPQFIKSVLWSQRFFIKALIDFKCPLIKIDYVSPFAEQTIRCKDNLINNTETVTSLNNWKNLPTCITTKFREEFLQIIIYATREQLIVFLFSYWINIFKIVNKDLLIHLIPEELKNI